MNVTTLSRRHFLQGSTATTAMLAVANPGLAEVKRPADPFIETLIGRMTLEEKVGQLSIFQDTARTGNLTLNPTPAMLASLDQVKRDIAAGAVSGYFNGLGVARARELQKVAVEQSKHKVPLLFAADVIHGLRTVFPIPLGEAASFDPELARRTARAAAVEATSQGLHWTFAPMVDVARDQRWGRVCEGSGEDTFLGATMAAARVKGFQGESLRNEDSLLACAKHFAAYGAVEGGMDYNQADISELALRQIHLPPFQSAFDAGALTTMASFNTILGVPSTGNRYLLTEILRHQMAFKGFVISDYNGDAELVEHGYAEDEADAALKAISAGCDMSLQSGLYRKHVPALVRAGKLKVAVLDEAVRRVLHVKKALGLFENPYRSLDERREKANIRQPDTVTLAREAGRKSCVMLKNESALLPLPKTGKKIALIGPFGADKANCTGAWAGFGDIQTCVPLADGLRAVLGDNLVVVKGCAVEKPLEGGIDAAVAAAKAADVVILAVGESNAMSGEAASRTDISLPASQLQLAEAVAATGKPTVVVLKHGRAIALSGALKKADAILCAWFLGSEEGNALADLIFGDHAPQGRLPVSFPQLPGQEPYYYDHPSSGRPQTGKDASFKARYRDASFEALYPFGFGLTYAQLAYGETSVSKPFISKSEKLLVSVSIKNTGTVAGHEVAQLYIRYKSASIVQPIRQLKGFQHVDINPGQTVNVRFEISAADLAFVHADFESVADPGKFEVWIAPSAAAGSAATFEMSAR